MHVTDPVNRIMSEPVFTIGPEETVSEAMRLFTAHRVHHIPVVEQHRVVGMLSSADMMGLRFFVPPPNAARDALPWDRLRAKTIMRTPAITVPEHESVQRAAERMAHNGFHALPVVDRDGRLVGIVTTTDIMHGCFHSQPDATAGDDLDEARRFPLADTHIAAVLASARRSVNSRRDPYGIAATLLAVQQRVHSLEEVVTAVKRYLNAGQDETLHAAVSKAIERADRLDEKMRHAVAPGLGVAS
jgi:CBS domain-containing protein